MFENGREIKIGQKTYRALFNVAALKAIVGRYGGVEEMGAKLESDYELAISEYAWIMAMLIGQGVALSNFENDTKDKAPTAEQLELIMKPRELISQREIIFSVIKDGMDSGEEGTAETEEVDEVLEEVLAGKNEMGVKG